MRLNYPYHPVPRTVRWTSAAADVTPATTTPPAEPAAAADDGDALETGGGNADLVGDVMRLCFAPVLQTFACAPALERWFDTTWGLMFKCFCIFATITLYIFVFIWLGAINSGVEVRAEALLQPPPDKPVGEPLSSLLRQAWGLERGSAGVCTMDTTLGAMTLHTYLIIRIIGTSLSAVPSLYLVGMATHHTMQIARLAIVYAQATHLCASH